MVIVDEAGAYLGSANFTGAGLGAKSGSRRNLEIGVWAKGPEWVSSLQALFDDFWMGESCEGCSFKANCPDPIRP
jgi:phosphatidylserine/phosphatidylglycerophosphate/cardiolipin synthase-like enzyme